MAGEKQRAELFELYSRHLSLYDKSTTALFRCPICQEVFSREALDGPVPFLTLAHIIPRSLGGKRCTLACRRCNNAMGQELEGDLVTHLRQEAWGAGAGQIQARLEGSFGEVGVTIERSPNSAGWTMRAIQKQSHPLYIESFGRYLREATGDPDPGLEFTASWVFRHKPRQVEAAIYQSAFLLLFSYFGYEFALHKHFAPLRQQILNPKTDMFRPPILVPGQETSATLVGSNNSTVMVLDDPPAIAAMLRLCPADGQPLVLAVVLPGMASPDIPAIPIIPLEFCGTVIPYRPKALLSEKFYLHRIWRDLQRTS